MNRILTLLLVGACAILLSRPASAQIDILGKISGEVDKKVDESVDDALHPKKKTDEKKTDDKKDDQNKQSSSNTGTASNTTTSAQAFKAYNNYDFKPGETVIFSDDFRDDVDGEFAAHWNLDAGQAVVNTINGERAFLLTDGNYAIVSPRLKTKSYLSDPFTIEFDYYQANSSQWAPMIRLEASDGSSPAVYFGKQVHTGSFPHDLEGNDIADDEAYYGKWHHGAIIYKNDQLKAYVDNVRALVVPHCDFTPVSVTFGGIGDQNVPITFKNVRIAGGGSQNMIGNIMTDGKFVTHGITFDVAKATLRPESMGVLNEIAKFLKENGAIHVEIDGYTDSDGDANSNVRLSDDRAGAVKTQLVAMGIDASRMSTKGFGSKNPIAPNNTPEGKAMNRRVEFVKQ